MPGFDGTGPFGQGPMTGWGMGPCGRGFRRGFGAGRGMGFGRGFGRRFFRGYGANPNYSIEDELEMLKREKELIEQEISGLEKELQNQTTE